MNTKQKIGFISGSIFFIVLIIIPPPDGMNPLAMRAAAVSILMAIFWVTEAISIFATSLMPIALFPILGVLDPSQIASSYGHHIVLLILGAFLVAKAIETNNLHKRIALITIRSIGVSRSLVMLSFMIASGFLSMWTSNNSTTLMMLPIGLAILNREKELGADISQFGPALMLSIAYSSSIGGTGTLVGTPPNLIFVSTSQELFPNAPNVLFTDWLKIGLPFVFIFLPIVWLYLIKFFGISGNLQGNDQIINQEYEELGKISYNEKNVLAIVILYALGFIFRDQWSGYLGISGFVKDSTVAFFAATALFIIPRKSMSGKKQNKRLLNWEEAKDIPWGISMLIGGGLAIASAFKSSGLIRWIGQSVNLDGIPILVVLFIVVTAMVFLTEINSNAATTAVFLPVLAGISEAGSFHPFILLIPATIAASCAFMLPSGTGPNASVLASGQLSIPQMARAGFGLNILAVIVIVVLFYFFIFPIMGV